MHTASTIRLAIFDLDGTLVDSRRDLATAANALVRELGGMPLSEAAVGDMVGEGAAVLVRRALAASGLDPADPGALPRFLELYDRHLVDTTRPYAGVTQALETLTGRMPLAVLTNKPQAAADRMLRELELAAYFVRVIGGDTPLGRKPDPAGLLSIARELGVSPPEAVLVGDSPIDAETARRAGARLCVASYGFGHRPAGADPVDLVAAVPADIPELLQRS